MKQTAGRDALGDFAPQFAALNDDVLFGEVWAREEQLSPRPQPHHRDGADGGRDNRFFVCIPSGRGEEKWDHQSGNRRGAHPSRLLLRVAEGLGRLPDGEGGLEGLKGPAGPGKRPSWSTLHGLKTDLQRSLPYE